MSNTRRGWTYTRRTFTAVAHTRKDWEDSIRP